jgi:HEPN domain-containing protein
LTAVQTRGYLAKAEEFLAAASDSLEAGRALAATSLAVHAGISASDAICGARTAQRAAGADHAQAAALLAQAGREGKDAAQLLTRLMPLKNRAEYEPQDVSKTTASRAVKQAERIVQIARQVVT